MLTAVLALRSSDSGVLFQARAHLLSDPKRTRPLLEIIDNFDCLYGRRMNNFLPLNFSTDKRTAYDCRY
jgi:hypothetical protein